MAVSKKVEIHHPEIGRDFTVQLGNERVDDDFELGRTDFVRYDQLDVKRIGDLWERITGSQPTLADESRVRDRLQSGHLIWQKENDGPFFATNVGILLLYPEPTVTFPQARISVEAYLQCHDDHPLPTTPNDFLETTEPLSTAIESVIAFIRRNTKNSFRIVGIDRIRVTEYPEEAVREALVNAVAHRDYSRGGEPVRVKLFKDDRITIRSPGALLKGVTIAKLKSGKYDAKSRNPLLATYLSRFERLEQRGRGIQLMKEKMKDHGLQEPEFDLQNEWFEVTLVGPGENLDNIKSSQVVWQISPSNKEKLNDCQNRIVAHVLAEGSVTTKWCIQTCDVVRDTAHRHLKQLVKLKILQQEGRGRATRYVLNPTQPAGE